MRDLCHRVPTWLPLSGWVSRRLGPRASLASCVFEDKLIWIRHVSRLLFSSKPLELLVEKTVSTCERQMGVGEALRRVFECIASGTLLEGAKAKRIFLTRRR